MARLIICLEKDGKTEKVIEARDPIGYPTEKSFQCQTPTNSLVKSIGVDFVFTPSQEQQQQQSQSHQSATKETNFLYATLF